MASTFFMLCAEYGTAEIPLKDCCEKYFGLELKGAGHQGRHQKLPVPAYRGGSQKSVWLIKAADLANFIDLQHAAATRDWEAINGKKFR